jgi:hypothetical protein
VKRHVALGLVLAVVLSAGPAVAADDRPDIVSITDRCPVSEGGYRYFSDFFEYRIRVWLTGCPWYHGESVVVQGSLARTDLITGSEQHDMTVHCEPGAPPPTDDRPHAHSSALPAPPAARPAAGFPAPAQSGEAHHEDVRRPPDNCVLSIVVEHPPIEHARYEGELRYPSELGERHETMALDCTTVEDFGGCDPPGSPPGVAPMKPGWLRPGAAA